jgi:hypothetical protein
VSACLFSFCLLFFSLIKAGIMLLDNLVFVIQGSNNVVDQLQSRCLD